MPHWKVSLYAETSMCLQSRIFLVLISQDSMSSWSSGRCRFSSVKALVVHPFPRPVCAGRSRVDWLWKKNVCTSESSQRLHAKLKICGVVYVNHIEFQPGKLRFKILMLKWWEESSRHPGRSARWARWAFWATEYRTEVHVTSPLPCCQDRCGSGLGFTVWSGWSGS